MDQRSVRRDAYVPDISVIPHRQADRVDILYLYALAPLAGQSAVCHVSGLLHHVSVHEDEVAHGAIRIACMGFFHLFHHHNRCRTYLEICHSGLYSPHHRRSGAAVQGKVSPGSGALFAFRHSAADEQSPADDVLLSITDSVHGNRMGCDGLATEADAPMGHRHCSGIGSRSAGSCRQFGIAL